MSTCAWIDRILNILILAATLVIAATLMARALKSLHARGRPVLEFATAQARKFLVHCFQSVRFMASLRYLAVDF